MKLRKNFTLSSEAVARGERLAAERSSSLSQIIEEQLLAIPAIAVTQEDYWPGPALQPIKRPGDKRHAYLQKKHR